MKSNISKRLLLSFIVLFLMGETYGQLSIKKKEKLIEKLTQAHQDVIASATNKDFTNMSKYYTDETLFIAEFHPLIIGKNRIASYYDSIYNRQTIKKYNRITKDIYAFEDRVVEWGVFDKTFEQNDGEAYTLNGKFINVWKLLKNGALQLLSQQWNYDHKIDEAINLRVAVNGLPLRYKTLAAQNVERSLQHELNAYYALGAEAVKKRDPLGRLHSYRKDGVFLAPHGEKAKIGYNAIKEYLIGYNAGKVTIDSIAVGLNHIEDYGKHLIKYSYYYVEASGDDWTYKGQGMGTDFLVRNASGRLQRMWQIGGEQPVPIEPIPAEIEAYHKMSVTSLVSNDASLRTDYYADTSFLMGEYQKVLQGKSMIEKYYNKFLQRFTINTYKKERLELLNLGDWKVETGTFEMELTQKDTKERKNYKGKYQNIWKRQEGSWKIFAEAWNYNHPIDNWAKFNFQDIPAYNQLNTTLAKLPLQVLALNELAEDFISAHDHVKWEQLYDKKAMLLYSHSPLYNGKKAISEHLKTHVQTLPTFNKLDIGSFYLTELDNYIIELGNHYADWSHGENSGISTGKNIRIWKKCTDGRLKIFRQTAMYDAD
ncbi:DUF4440 domain-containing protein [Spongiivirga sp. MCCC 1A20706]|uniref:DUF4440 domain-containing protein n=1 Tax=Spongiivirga sp. MCCC 1A20706 TaxID=3160963 RepID=UPI0039773361